MAQALVVIAALNTFGNWLTTTISTEVLAHSSINTKALILTIYTPRDLMYYKRM